MTGATWSYRVWSTVTIGTKWLGWTPGAPSASSIFAGSMPSCCWKSAFTWLRSRIARGSRPMTRPGRPIANGWPAESRIGARSGTSRVRARCCPARSDGWITAGDQSTSHRPSLRSSDRVPS